MVKTTIFIVSLGSRGNSVVKRKFSSGSVSSRVFKFISIVSGQAMMWAKLVGASFSFTFSTIRNSVRGRNIAARKADLTGPLQAPGGGDGRCHDICRFIV